MLIALAVLLVASTSGLAAVHLRAVRDAVGREAPDLLRKIERAPRDERLAIVGASARAATFEATLASALEGVDDDARRIAAANEALGDLALLLEARARWAPAAVRIVLFGAFLLAALALIEWDLVAAGVVVGLGAAGVAIAVIVGSRAREIERTQRRLADALVEALLPATPRDLQPTARKRRDRA